MLRRVYLLAIALLPLSFIYGQQKAIDSLTRELDATQDRIRRVDLLNELATTNYDYDTEKGFQRASEAYELAKELHYLRGMRRALTLKGFYYVENGDNETGLEFYRQASAVDLPEDELLAYNQVMIGNVFRNIAAYDSARKYYNLSINLLARLNAPTQLAYAYKNLGRLHAIEWKNQQARESFQKALTIYESIGRKRGIADAYILLAEVALNESDIPEATRLVQRGCDLATEVEDEFLIMMCQIQQGELSLRLGEYPKALRLYFEALGAIKSKDLTSHLRRLYTDVGDVYRALGQNDVAVKYYNEVLTIAQKVDSKLDIARIHGHLGVIYRNENKLKEAHESLRNSIQLRKEIGDLHGLGVSYNAQGLTYYQEKKHEQALSALQEAFRIRKQINHKEGMASCLYNMSLVYLDKKQFPKALELQMQGIAIEESIGNPYGLGFSNNRLGNLYTKLGKFAQAESHLKRAATIAAQIKSNTLLMNNSLYWSEYFDLRKDKSKALDYYKKYSVLHDSVFRDINAQKLAELQALYQMEKKDQEIALLNQEKINRENEIKLQRSRINTQNIILASVISVLILVSLIAIISYRLNQKIQKANREITEQKEEIQSQAEELMEASETIADINKKLEVKIEERTLALSQAYKELDTFFYRSSHDFRRPLTTFLGLAEVAKVTVKDVAALELFEKVKETAVNLDKMLVKLQSISDVGSQQLFYKEVFIKEIFETVCDSFRDELGRKNIKTSIEIKLNHPFVSYPALIKIVMENLVENAIQFSGLNNPFIKIKVVQTGDYITIDFQDNGQGIAREYQEQIFEMYFRGNERSKGNGLGLYIVKKAVEKLDGSISVSSIPQVGSTFTVMLPVTRPLTSSTPIYKVG